MGLPSCSFLYLLTTFTYSFNSAIHGSTPTIFESSLLLGLAIHDELDEGELDAEKLDSQEEEDGKDTAEEEDGKQNQLLNERLGLILKTTLFNNILTIGS
jgi:hypothetical protein